MQKAYFHHEQVLCDFSKHFCHCISHIYNYFYLHEQFPYEFSDQMTFRKIHYKRFKITIFFTAIEKNLVAAVEAICRLGADLSSASGLDPPMWIALKTNQDLASVLVRYGADTDCWAEGKKMTKM